MSFSNIKYTSEDTYYITHNDEFAKTHSERLVKKVLNYWYDKNAFELIKEQFVVIDRQDLKNETTQSDGYTSIMEKLDKLETIIKKL